MVRVVVLLFSCVRIFFSWVCLVIDVCLIILIRFFVISVVVLSVMVFRLIEGFRDIFWLLIIVLRMVLCLVLFGVVIFSLWVKSLWILLGILLILFVVVMSILVFFRIFFIVDLI